MKKEKKAPLGRLFRIKLISAVLRNNEASTNQELRDYFLNILSKFGIKANPRGAPVLSKKEKWALFEKGKLYSKGKIYEIYVPKSEFKKFRKEIGFRDPRKAKMLDRLISQA